MVSISGMEWSLRLTWIIALLLFLCFGASCSRPDFDASVQSPHGTSLPFNRQPSENGVSPTAALLPKEIPAGTPITVRLQAGLSSSASRSGDSFDAVLDEPVVVEGQTLVPQGTRVIGRIVAAKKSDQVQNPGYLRLTLATLTLHGSPVAVQASSIFVKGKSATDRSLMKGNATGLAGAAYSTAQKNVGFLAEQRLTFRLTQSLPLPS